MQKKTFINDKSGNSGIFCDMIYSSLQRNGINRQGNL